MLSVVLGGVELRVSWQPFPYIECVFENDLVGLDAAGTGCDQSDTADRSTAEIAVDSYEFPPASANSSSDATRPMCSDTPPGSVAASMLTIRFPIWVWIGWPARPNQNRQPRTPRPAESQTQDPSWLAGSATRTRTWLWRSPHSRIYLANPAGTHPLGNTDFAETIWRAAENPMPAMAN